LEKSGLKFTQEVTMSDSESISSNKRWISCAISILERIFPSPRGFKVRLWNSEELPADSSALFTLVLNHPGALRRMFSPPIELSLGEAFINKDFDIEGDLIAAFAWMESISAKPFSPGDLVHLLGDMRALPHGNSGQLSGRGPMKLSSVQHSGQRVVRAALRLP
jgi:cyclopropane-fatty-acyl-phospholipid synthase